MIENEIVGTAINIALIIMVALLLPCFYKVWASDDSADRLLAIDLITTLLVGIIILLALVDGATLLVDMGIALAAIAFVGTLALARYISEGRVF